MSVRALLTQPVLHLRHQPGAEDDYGNPVDAYVPVGEQLGRLEQRSTVELTQDRQTVISDWVLALNPEAVVGPQDQFVDAYGRTFEVVGAPAMRSSPTRDFLVEVSLRHVSSTNGIPAGRTIVYDGGHISGWDLTDPILGA